MAYATLLSLESIIHPILDQDRFSLSPHGKAQIISLDKYVVSLQAFLEDFSDKAKILEARIRDVAAEAEDIIEGFLSDRIRFSYGYATWMAILGEMMFNHQLQKVRAEMDSIATEVVGIKESVKVKHQQIGDSVGATPLSQVADVGEINVVGLNEDLIAIKDKLCRGAPQLQALPIFGMGGIGKTTLARNAYGDQLIVEHFQIRVWVTVSQDYSQRRILLGLLDSIKEFDQEFKEEDNERYGEMANSPAENYKKEKVHELSNSEMALKIHKILTCRRFLIVMDDIWSTKVLDDVKHLFPNYNNGSRIMLTTRLIEVARYANSSILPHEMRLMDADQSWDLLRKKVFVHKDRIPQELESIGREIARSCGGLPLAIVVIAGLLSTMSKSPTSWEEVARNVRSSLATTDGQIEKILSLSYHHLPHHLRPCFLYMGGFPEHHEIKATDLIRLWIAESFVKPVVSKSFEDTAEGYLEDLVDRSLIVVTKKKLDGKIKLCSLHDMVREMCIKLSQEEKFLVHVKGSRASKVLRRMKDLRRIIISHSDLNSFSNIFSSNIRTIIYFQDQLRSLCSFRLLRVLVLPRVSFESPLVPDQFFELFHLRYFSYWCHYPIPRAISNLQSLQTLIIRGLKESLPYEIWNMPQLRHLIVYGTGLADPNADTSSLENLQTLRVKNLKCSISMLDLIPNLRKLWLTYSYASGELLLDNLVHICRLEKLHLELGYGWRNFGKPNLLVPRSLKKLTLQGWGSRGPYLDIVGPFPNLEVLKLKNFNFMIDEWRTNENDFPQLKFLLIEKSDIIQWETESTHFPRLKALHLHYCMDLSEIPECIGEIPTLELIELKLCTESLADSVKRIQEEARSYGDDAFQVRYKDDDVPIEDRLSLVRIHADRRVFRTWKRLQDHPVKKPTERIKSRKRCQLMPQSAALMFLSAKTSPSTDQ